MYGTLIADVFLELITYGVPWYATLMISLSMVDRGRWLRNVTKIHCSRFLCTLRTVTVENSIVLLLFYLCELR